jgi:Zn-dependent protease/CBS domain-containing protein
MFGHRKELFKILGFTVKVDISWIIIALLVTWSLANGFFPAYYEGLSTVTYWWMAIAGALGLFLSIIVHEFSHSLVARQFGMPMKGITLFIFGGVAEMNDEPPSPKSEFFMAIAGPLISIVLGFLFFGIFTAGRGIGLPQYFTGIFQYLGWINWLLAGFNLIPAYPLDGGRILRSVLWHWKGKLAWATRITSNLGAGFGFFLSFLGIVNLFSGYFISGLWWILIGLFVSNASKMSYQRLILTRALEGESASRFMKKQVVSVSRELTLDEFVHQYLYEHYYKMFPVVHDHNLVGCITINDLKKVPKAQWPDKKISEVTEPCSETNTVHPDTDATQALSLMNQSGNSRLLVVKNGQLAGVITLKDMLRFLSVKMELEGEPLKNLSFNQK